MEKSLFERVELEGDILQAVSAGQIVPHYQPIVEMRSGKVLGFEALARWNHPTKGLLLPAGIIPVAENTGMIGDLTCSLLSQAVEDAKHWPKNAILSINLSPLQLMDSWLAGRLLSTISDSGFSATRLQAEITENALIDNTQEARRVLDSLRRLGVRLALDDFGSGYAGVRYLRELQFDRLKIDRSYIRDLVTSAGDAKLVGAILDLARALDIEVIAEGVENEETRERLVQMGCVVGQGYLFSKPMPAADVLCFFGSEEQRLSA